MENKVDLFIVGCIKGGTTWLYDVLSTSPEIFSPKLKEPHYFSRIKQKRPHIKHVEDFKEYLSLFESGESYKYRMDGSASYLYEKNTAKRICNYNPTAKIVILLRHPVRRAFSHYQMFLREGVLDGDFEAVIKSDYTGGDSINESSCYIKMGLYFHQVKSYIDCFGSNVLVLSYSDLLRSKYQLVEDVAEFIGIDFTNIEIKNEKTNAAALPKGNISRLILGTDLLRYTVQIIFTKSFRKFIKNRYLLEQSKLKLQDDFVAKIYENYFKDDSERLFQLLGRRMWDDVNDL